MKDSTIIQTSSEVMSLGQAVSIPVVYFQRFLEYALRHIKAVLEADGCDILCQLFLSYSLSR